MATPKRENKQVCYVEWLVAAVGNKVEYYLLQVVVDIGDAWVCTTGPFSSAPPPEFCYLISVFNADYNSDETADNVL